MTSPNILQLLAARAASSLCDWVNIAPLRKADNGDRTGDGLGLVFVAMVHTKAPPPPPDALEKLTAVLLAMMQDRTRESGGGCYISLDCDYHPNRALVDVAERAGLAGVTWPNKSTITISTVYSDGSGSNRVTVSQGYRAPTFYHHCLPEEGGWLVTREFTVAAPILDVCLAAAKAGHPALVWQPFDQASSVTSV